MNEQLFLRRAIELGNQKDAPYNFGAVVVKDGEIIGEGYNQVHETNDPSAHAEILALKSAAQKIGSHNLDGAVLYGSHEPCVMCFVAAAWANITRVVYATEAIDQSLRYELSGTTLNDIAAMLQGRSIRAEHVTIEE